MLSKIGSGLFVSLPKFISMPQLLMQVFGSLLTIGCIVVMQDFQSFAIQNLTTGVVAKNIAELPAVAAAATARLCTHPLLHVLFEVHHAPCTFAWMHPESQVFIARVSTS